MRVLMAAFGSRGDVLPRVALAMALKARGHEVALACVENFRSLVESYGLFWMRLGAYPPESEEVEVLRRVMRDPDPGRRGEKLLAELFVPMLPGIIRQLAAMSDYFDLIAVNDLLAAAALPNDWFSPKRLVVTITAQPIGGFAKMLSQSPWPKLVGSHPCLLPSDHGLGDDFHLTDFWLPGEAEPFCPPHVLEAFLDEGPPPVVVAFGSACGRDPYFSENTLHEAVRLAGVRAIIQDTRRRQGESGVWLSAPFMIVVGEIPYDWLFKYAGCVVHHGGAGTIAEALRAGRPSVALPQYGDQQYWAQRIEAVGASAGTLLPDEVTSETLSAMIVRALEDRSFGVTAGRIGKMIDPGQGIAKACDLMESLGRATQS